MSEATDPITASVMDMTHGGPAKGLSVTLSKQARSRWEVIGRNRTDSEGRVHGLLAPGNLEVGVYRVRFETADYFRAKGITGCLHPWIDVVVQVTDANGHYGVPLAVSPFGYSTHCGR
ncbi:transthyretin-like protein [Plesiocystis pacifica SIR-1]|uniref:5-hydroxyisourate hydrolase n=1 Tax=Plesiocystis pacifica SIR-1 TaxID=391625 RepID=A6G332_9BACT|nr:hydroxyisourate hydrolase [Plesiocystis pacifica]EDM79657.1 transthyretin-like protein [Plesiocystis pacifica SIR-1]